MEERLAAAREALHAAMKKVTDVDGVIVHGGIQIIVDITAYTGIAGCEGREVRDKVYQAEMELMSQYPDVLFDFKVK
jgi:hypothetical protein